ncbi:MarR family winged helix-turn-helix transcriptional regulator [Streptomyces sp. V4I2]|uniref:MarR family winged helix-turn-helix transcriptional regulator n=1 Tax=Streptomyces sp. V4I2 TaxID=3042280 RepID=UPI0027899003|nr:MarR family transcriptional regulator [Streptomyces sp. V4I2]MDQ1051465.1 DNA-binding MarR family transcriptional regulator [Streptomyces sp. V4I2]
MRSMPSPLLADLLSISTASVTSALHTLERAGLLTRTPQPDDGRMLVVALTEQGETVIDEFLHWWTAHRQKSWLEHLPPEEELTLARLLAKVSRHQPQPLTERQRRLIPPH